MKNKTNANLLVTATVICLTLLMFAMNSYCRRSADIYASQIREEALEHAKTDSSYSYAYWNDYEFSINSGNWIYPLYMEYKEDRKVSYGDLIIENMNDLSVENRDRINEHLSNMMSQFHSMYSGIHYYILDENVEQGTQIYTNDSTLSSYLDSTFDSSNNDTWFLTLSFDEEGTLKILNSKTKVKTTLLQETLSENRMSIRNASDTANHSIQFKTFKNIKFVFSISSDSGLGVDYTQEINNAYHSNYTDMIQNKLSSMFIFLMLIMAIISYLLSKNITKESSLCKTLMSIPLEIILFIFVFAFLFFITNSYQHYIISGAATSFLMDASCYVICYAAILYVVILFRSMKEKGAYTLHTVSIFFGDSKRFSDKLKSFYHYLNNMDFTDDSNKRILLLTLFNLILLLIFGSLGPFFLIPYCFFQYYIFTTRQKKQRDDFRAVKDITSRISNGDYQEPLDKELGVYDPLKDDLVNIQQGIEEAVAKEMTSQRMKNELITNVSHDLKTPLTAIISYIDLLKNAEISEEERINYLNTLEKSADRLKHLIEDLFDISKANSGNVSLEYMEVDLISLLKQVEMECRNTLDQRFLTIKYHLSDEKVLIDLDPQKACRIFENLISNASKYALEHTRIFITVMDFDSRIDVEIKNVSKDELDFTPEEIVERFTRGDKSRNTDGSGLGLAIAKSFTELMNGSMRIDIDGDVFKVQICFYKKEHTETA